MTRERLAGVLLLVAVVLGSVLFARIDGRRVAGVATAVPGATAPSVGDCVAGVAGPLTVPTRAAFPPSSLSVASVGETSVTYSDCSGEHVGEVVAYRLTPVTDGEPSKELDNAWCQDVGAGYQSMMQWRFRGATSGLWQPSTNQRFVAILSASTEGSWGACAVLAPGLELYPGSFVESMSGQQAPPPFGLCRSGDHADRWVSCSSPHRVQEFGVAVEAGMSSREAVAACGELIKAMSGMPDVNAGGLLKVQVVGGNTEAGGGDFGDADLDPDSTFGRCRLIVVGPHQLTGTLLGIGANELPLG